VRTRPGRTILGAAVVDDILAILVLSVAVGIAEDGRVDPGDILLTASLSAAFVGFVALGGGRLLRARPGLLTVPRFADSPLLPAVLLCLGLAVVAGEIGLAGIIGAFLAGMVIAESPDRAAVENEVGPLYAFFPPFFFAAIGIQLDLEALADGSTLLLLLGVTALAVVTKLAGGWLGARSLGARDALVVGVGMIPRGEVGIIVASIGAAEGVVTDRLFAVIVGMAVLTTLIVPPALRVLFLHRDDLDDPPPATAPG
jgi:Kef-type K+ transport system membrane component KefB